MPTFWGGKNVIQFAASKRHIGLYPGPEAVEAFRDKLAGYETSKGNHLVGLSGTAAAGADRRDCKMLLEASFNLTDVGEVFAHDPHSSCSRRTGLAYIPQYSVPYNARPPDS